MASWLTPEWKKPSEVADEQYRQTRAQGLASGALQSKWYL